MLGTLLLDPATLPRVRGGDLKATDFFLESHRIIYSAVLALDARGSGVDLLLLDEELRRAGQIEAVGGPATLALLIEQASIATYLGAYIDVVVEHAVKREAIQRATSLITRAFSNNGGSAELLVDVAAVSEILQRRRGQQFPLPMSLAAFQAAPPPAPEWLVDKLILASTNGWLGAGAKVGKSYLALDLLLSCALGEPWLGQFPVSRPLAVVLVEEEDSAWRVYQRLQRLIAGRGLEEWPPNFHLSVRRGLHIDDAATFEPFTRWLSSVHPDLIVWDVFNLLHVQDERKPDQIMPVLRRLDGLRNTLGVANLLLHHQRKPSVMGADTASGGQKLRGPSEFWGWAENSLYLTPLRGKGALIVEPESKDAVLEPFKVHLEDRPDGSRSWVFDGVVAAKISRGDERRQRLITVLREHGSAMNKEDLARAIGITPQRLMPHLNALKEEGVVEWLPDPEAQRSGRRLWRLSAEADEQNAPGERVEPGF